MSYPLMMNGKRADFVTNSAVFINNGNHFDGYYGGLLNPNGRRLGWDVMHCPTPWKQAATCTNFYYINVPQDNYGTCMNFQSVTKVTDPARNTTVTLNAHYVATSYGFNVTITNFTSSPDGFTYVFGPNIHYYRGIGGSTADPVKYFLLGISGDYQIEWTLDLSFPRQYGYGKVLGGELIRRNGIYYKDDNIPYTVTDPCYKLNYVTPYYNNATVETEFCCTLFATSTK